MRPDSRELAQFMFAQHFPTGSDVKEDHSKCHVCLKPGPLSREHVPPKSAFNECNKLWDRLVVSDQEAKARQATIRGGFRVETLCGDCNNRICSIYASEYVKFVKSLVEKPQIFDSVEEPKWLKIEQDTLFLAKEIATMILAVESLPYAMLHGVLRNFVLDKDSVIDPGFKVLGFLVPNRVESGTIARFHSRMDKKYYFTGGEISTYPFGFVYATEIGSGYEPEKLADLTDWFMVSDKSLRRDRVIKLFTRITAVDSIQVGFGQSRIRPQIDYVGVGFI